MFIYFFVVLPQVPESGPLPRREFMLRFIYIPSFNCSSTHERIYQINNGILHLARQTNARLSAGHRFYFAISVAAYQKARLEPKAARQRKNRK